MASYFVLLSIFCALHLMISESVMNFQRFHHYPALRETVCDSNDVLFSVSADTDMACSAFCVQMNSCRSYMYNSGTRHCIGCSEKYTETSSIHIVAGYGYYEITTREHSIRRYVILSILFYLITLEGRRGTSDKFATIPFHLDLFSAALVELAKSIPVHSLILSSHLFFCLPLFLFPFSVPCMIVFAKPEDLETWPNHLSFRFLTRVRSSSYSPMAAWIFLRTSSLVTWSLYHLIMSYVIVIP